MNQNRKVTGKAMSMPGGLAVGGFVSLASTLLLAAVLAKMVEKEILAPEKIGYGVLILLIVSSFVGALVANRKIKRQRLAVCLLSGGIYFLILISMTALFFGGQYSAIPETALLVFCGSGLAILLGLRGNGKPGRKIKIAAR